MPNLEKENNIRVDFDGRVWRRLDKKTKELLDDSECIDIDVNRLDTYKFYKNARLFVSPCNMWYTYGLSAFTGTEILPIEYKWYLHLRKNSNQDRD